jgi:hypothetical protein
MGGSKRFRARNIGDPEERTSFAADLPFRPSTGVDKTPICDEAMADEFCVLFMISALFTSAL